jgi:hypothetical protein
MSSETCLAPHEAGIFLPRWFLCASQSARTNELAFWYA